MRLSGHSGFSRLSGLVAMAIAAVAATAFAADAPKNPQDLLRELQNASRDKKVALDVVTNAYQAVAACTNLNANQRFDMAKSFLSAHTDRGRRDDALAFAKSMATVAELPPSRRAELLSTAARSFADENKGNAFGGYRNDGFLKAESIYKEILSIPGATASEKIAAYRDMANMRLEADRDIPGAFALLDKAVALPGLEPEQKARAVLNKADLHKRVGEYDKALALLAPIVADASFPNNFRRDVLHRTFSIAGAQGGTEAELKARRESMAKYKDDKGNPLFSEGELARFCAENSADIAWAVSHYRKAAAEWTPNAGERGFPDIGRLHKAFSTAGFDVFSKEMPAVVKKLENSPNLLGRLFGDMTGRDPGPASKNPRYPEFVLSLLDGVPATNRPPVGKLFDYASKHPAISARAAGYAREIGKLPADDKSVGGDTRKNAAVVTALADANGNGGRAVQLLNAWLQKNPPDDNLKRAEFLLRAVKRAAILRQEDVARTIYAEYAKLVRKEEPRSLPCPYIENAPQDISALLASPFYRNGKKGLADRKFGDDLEFIIATDVTANRTMTEFNGKPFKPTEVFAFCDRYGVKVMLRQFCDKETLEKFKNGFGGIGGYEAYIVPGADAPYTFLGFGPGATKLSSDFLTQYDNGTGYRNLKSEDDSILLSNYVADDSVVSLLSFSWAKEFAALPSNGDKWYFEPICWSNGGWSWGGSKTVHNRSTFGALVFEGITPKAAAAIRRIILKKASDAYWNAKSGRSNGCIEIWKDPELGDPAFYAECVAPIVARLDPYAGRVKADMTDEDVMDVYEHAAKDWLNMEFIVSRLRTRYLAAKRVSE